MKTLKFAPHLVPLILNGSKRTTWRLFDDKGLQVGDELTLIKRPELRPFAEAKITAVSTKSLKNVDKKDMEGHESVGSPEQMYKTYSDYYKQEVTEDTEVKIIKFELTKIING